jgi:hypothetical protein
VEWFVYSVDIEDHLCVIEVAVMNIFSFGDINFDCNYD